MQLVNKTRKTILAQNLIIPESLVEKSLGLLKYKKPQAMLLKTHFGIHTFGMQYPIDVVILDKNNKVVQIKTDLKPNNIFVWNIKYDCVIELPKGSVNITRTKIYDEILLVK